MIAETSSFPGQPLQEPSVQFREPYRTQFRDMILSGAGRVDIHDSPVVGGYAVAGHVSEPFLLREINRVDLHRRHLCRYLSEHVKPSRILDVGCGTGGLSVALALTFPGSRITGVDPDAGSVRAAGVRASGYGVDRVEFLKIETNGGLPLPDRAFDLVTCTSVIEFITDFEDRVKLLSELQRVTAPGGSVFITTPNPIRLREQHSKRLFGDWIRKPGYPWAFSRWKLASLFPGWEAIQMYGRLRDKLGVGLPDAALRAASFIAPWQMVLFKKARS